MKFFKSNNDIEELKKEVSLLKVQMAYKTQEVDKLKTDVEALQRFCYDMGGEITDLKKKVNELLLLTNST